MHWNRPSVNVAMISFMMHGNVTSDQYDVSLSNRGVNLTTISCAKSLGIIIDDNLMFDAHADCAL